MIERDIFNKPNKNFIPHFEKYTPGEEEVKHWLLWRSIKQDIVNLRRNIGSTENLPFKQEMISVFLSLKDRYLKHYPERLDEIDIFFDFFDYFCYKNKTNELDKIRKSFDAKEYEKKITDFVKKNINDTRKINNFWQTFKRLSFGNDEYKSFMTDLKNMIMLNVGK